MRLIVRHLICWSIFWAASVSALAENYPTKPITIVVPQQAGSWADNITRPLAIALQKILGQSIVVDNRIGGNGILGVQNVARAKPDGYTLLFTSSAAFVTNLGMYKKLPYDPLTDFRSVAGVAATTMMFVSRPELGVNNIDELVAYARTRQDPLEIGRGSSTAQLATSLLRASSAMKVSDIPYKGTPQMVTDLLSGVVQVGVLDDASGSVYVKSGQLRALATLGAARTGFLPEVPTLSEKFPGVTLVSWGGLAAPAGTPDEVVRVLYEAVALAIKTPEVQKRFASAGITTQLMTPAVMDKTIQTDIPRWGALMREAGIEPN